MLVVPRARVDMVTEWSIPGSDGLKIYGSTHLPEGDASGVVIIVHGYMGFKEYGMFLCHYIVAYYGL